MRSALITDKGKVHHAGRRRAAGPNRPFKAAGGPEDAMIAERDGLGLIILAGRTPRVNGRSSRPYAIRGGLSRRSGPAALQADYANFQRPARPGATAPGGGKAAQRAATFGKLSPPDRPVTPDRPTARLAAEGWRPSDAALMRARELAAAGLFGPARRHSRAGVLKGRGAAAKKPAALPARLSGNGRDR